MKIECPYCGAKQNVNHDDGFGYAEDVLHEMECDFCEKYFVFRTSISYHYESFCANCLNDGNHDFQLTHTFPVEFSKMRCSMCEQERELTDEEKQKFGIGTIENYLKSIKQ